MVVFFQTVVRGSGALLAAVKIKQRGKTKTETELAVQYHSQDKHSGCSISDFSWLLELRNRDGKIKVRNSEDRWPPGYNDQRQPTFEVQTRSSSFYNGEWKDEGEKTEGRRGNQDRKKRWVVVHISTHFKHVTERNKQRCKIM